MFATYTELWNIFPFIITEIFQYLCRQTKQVMGIHFVTRSYGTMHGLVHNVKNPLDLFG